MDDNTKCWRCGVVFPEPVPDPWEPICDDCYPLAVEESNARRKTGREHRTHRKHKNRKHERGK